MSSTIVRIVFERGLEVGGAPYGVQLNSNGGSLDQIVTEIWTRFTSRPIILTNRYSLNGSNRDGLTMEDSNWLLGIDRKHLGVVLSDLSQSFLRVDNASLQKSLDLLYELNGAAYHCTHLALIYAKICRQMRRFSSIEGFGASEHSSFQGQEEGYFEFDALVSKARRSFDRLGYIVWDFFGRTRHSCPENFERIVESCEDLPDGLRIQLTESWHKMGRRLKDYRDCVHHFGTLEFGMSSAWMTRHDNDVWTTQLRIPDNPESKSKRRYSYAGDLDALTYGWTVTSELIYLCSSVVNGLKQTSSEETNRA